MILKTGYNFIIFYFNICGKLFVIRGAIHDFSVCLRTGSNPADINRFRSDTGKGFKYLPKVLIDE